MVRSERGVVVLDLDGDGHEQTGWAVLYLHIAARERVPVGQHLYPGERIGHPSCEGGIATGTHVHLARKFNGSGSPPTGRCPSCWTAGSPTAAVPLTKAGWKRKGGGWKPVRVAGRKTR